MESQGAAKPMYLADMTKILSAESFATPYTNRAVPSRPLQDPENLGDSRTLVDLVCNDTVLDFRPPRSLPRNPGPLLIAWSAGAKEPCGTPRPRSSGSVLYRLSSEAIREIAACKAFGEYVSPERTARRITLWVAFQTSDEDLQNIFWENNQEVDLKNAQGAFEAHVPAKAVRAFKAVVGGSRFQTIGYAAHHVTADWEPPDFALAYAFWAYLKGVWNARTLSIDHFYAVQWLREKAVKDAPGTTQHRPFRIDLPIPWGWLVADAIRRWRPGVPLRPMGEGLIMLRKFTQDQLPDATTPKRRERLLIHGLHRTLEAFGYRTNPSKVGEFILDFFEKVPPAVKPVFVVGTILIHILRQAVPRSRIKREVRLLMNRNRAILGRFIEGRPDRG